MFQNVLSALTQARAAATINHDLRTLERHRKHPSWVEVRKRLFFGTVR